MWPMGGGGSPAAAGPQTGPQPACGPADPSQGQAAGRQAGPSAVPGTSDLPRKWRVGPLRGGGDDSCPPGAGWRVPLSGGRVSAAPATCGGLWQDRGPIRRATTPVYSTGYQQQHAQQAVGPPALKSPPAGLPPHPPRLQARPQPRPPCRRAAAAGITNQNTPAAPHKQRTSRLGPAPTWALSGSGGGEPGGSRTLLDTLRLHLPHTQLRIWHPAPAAPLRNRTACCTRRLQSVAAFGSQRGEAIEGVLQGGPGDAAPARRGSARPSAPLAGARGYSNSSSLLLRRRACVAGYAACVSSRPRA